MKHLFVARHGNYSRETWALDDSGHQQIEVLGKAVKEILNGSSARVISSTALRAVNTSEILIAQLGLQEFEQIPYLWSGPGAPEDGYLLYSGEARLMELVNERRETADGLIMVTHLEIAEEFPSYFLKREFDRGEHIKEIRKGRAVHLNLENKTYQIIPT